MSDQQPKAELSMAQRFAIQVFRKKTEELTIEELRDLAVFEREQLFLQKNSYDELIKKNWAL